MGGIHIVFFLCVFCILHGFAIVVMEEKLNEGNAFTW